MKTRNRIILFISIAVLVFYQGCSPMKPIQTVNKVDLNRFMGDWYVIGHIPTSIEKEAYNAMESYELAENGTISTTFTFNKGALDGPQKTYTPKGFIRDKTSNAVWGMQFVWPFKAEFRIVYLDEDYTQTIIGRTKRDYVWIMARTPTIPTEDYQEILSLLEQEGYDINRIRQVPHDQEP